MAILNMLKVCFDSFPQSDKKVKHRKAVSRRHEIQDNESNTNRASYFTKLSLADNLGRQKN